MGRKGTVKKGVGRGDATKITVTEEIRQVFDRIVHELLENCYFSTLGSTSQNDWLLLVRVAMAQNYFDSVCIKYITLNF